MSEYRKDPKSEEILELHRRLARAILERDQLESQHRMACLRNAELTQELMNLKKGVQSHDDQNRIR